jgi:hypothetical protein
MRIDAASAASLQTTFSTVNELGVRNEKRKKVFAK